MWSLLRSRSRTIESSSPPHLPPARPSTASGPLAATSTTPERWPRSPPSRECARSSGCRPARPRQQMVKRARDQSGGIGARAPGATASVQVGEAVAGGTGFLWEINGTDGTLRITADAAYPELYPLTGAGAHGRNEPAELAVPAALTQKWPALTSLEGAPAYNVGRAYAAFAADIENGTHTVPDFADAVRRHEVIAAIERSAASGERVKV